MSSIKVANIKPLSDFIRNSKSHIQSLQRSGEAEVLTVNGEAAVVIQSAEQFEKLSALAEQARQDDRLREALEYFENGGEGKTADEVFRSLRSKK